LFDKWPQHWISSGGAKEESKIFEIAIDDQQGDTGFNLQALEHP
jgi:hypothetical protein